MRKKIKIALLQMDVGCDIDANIAKAGELIARASRTGAKIACLPELFYYMGDFSRFKEIAKNRFDETIYFLTEQAKLCNINIVGGSILKMKNKAKPINVCHFIGRDGKIKSSYSKMHLFDIRIPGKIIFEESGFLSPGNDATILKTEFGTIGFAICNDIRYPELFRKMISAGAELIFIPSAFTKFTGKSHWLALNRVRAIENQCYIAAVNQSGKNASGVEFFGSSIVVDPWGRVIAGGKSKGSAVITCEIDLEPLRKIRRELPALKKIKNKIELKKFRSKI